VPQPRKSPNGWKIDAEYKRRGTKRVFRRMRHFCPSCPRDIQRDIDESLPICTAQEGLLEVEECARFAILNEDELKGTARKMVLRALAILDVARMRAEKETG
jgi:hypothetical protein